MGIKKDKFIFILGLCLILNAQYADLSSWTNINSGSSDSQTGRWEIVPGTDNAKVKQTKNCRWMTFYLSDVNVFNTRVTGEIRIDASDDDFVGFVFSVKKPLTVAEGSVCDYDFFLVDWNKDGSSNEYRPQSGASLTKYSGDFSKYMGPDHSDDWQSINTFPDDHSPIWRVPHYWDAGQDYEILDSDLGATGTAAGKGWRRDINYRFEMELRHNYVHITIDDIDNGNNVIELEYSGADNYFTEGRFGFMNMSQAGVTYGNYQEFPFPPIAVSDTLTINEDEVFNIAAPGILSNDTTFSTLNGDPTVELFDDRLIAAHPFNFFDDGSFDYTPDTDFFGTDSFSYKVIDGTVYSEDSAWVYLHVLPVNDPPVIDEDDAFDDGQKDVAVTEDTPQTFTLSASDIDSNEDELRWTITTSPVNGTLEFQPASAVSGTDVTLLYTPNPDYFGPDQAVIMVSDGHIGGDSTDIVTITFDVTPVNDPPVIDEEDALNDSIKVIQVTEDTQRIFDLIGSDKETSDANLLWEIETPPDPAIGNLILNNAGGLGIPGNFTYTPEPDNTSDNEAVILLKDSLNGFDRVTLKFKMTGENDPPEITQGDSITVTLDEDEDPTAFVLSLDATDNDNDNLSWSIQAGTGPFNASSSGVNSSGTNNWHADVDYDPLPDYNGNDSMVVICSDGIDTDQIKVKIIINPINDKPQISHDAITDTTVYADEDSFVDFNLFATDIETAQSDLEWRLLTNPVHGTVTPANVTGVPAIFRFEPQADNTTATSVLVEVTDDDASPLTDTLLVNLVVNPVNDRPDIEQGDELAVQVMEDTTEVFSLSATDIDTELTDLRWRTLTNPQNGQITYTSDTGGNVSVNYIPDPDFYGNDEAEIEVSDRGTPVGLDSITVLFTINPVNDQPSFVLKNDAYSKLNDFQLQAIEYNSTSASTTLSNKVDYTEKYFGCSAGIDVVVPKNVAAYTENGQISSYDRGDATTTGLEQGVQGHTYNVTTDNNGLFVNLPVIDELTGDLLVEPAFGAEGIANVTAVMRDRNIEEGESAALDSDPQTFKIIIRNEKPEVKNTEQDTLTFYVNEDEILSSQIISAEDANNDVLIWTSVSNVSNGTLQLPTLPATGNDIEFTYTPDPNYHGTDYFTLEVSDGNTSTSLSDLANVKIIVVPVDDKCEVLGRSFTIYEGDTWEYEPEVTDIDTEDSVLISKIISFTPEQSNDPIVNMDRKTLSWTPDYDQEGDYVLTVEVSTGPDQDAAFMKEVSVRDTAVYDIKVLNTDRPIVWDKIPKYSILEGDSLMFYIHAEDPDTDVVTYSMNPVEPYANAHLDESSGKFGWRPGYHVVEDHAPPRVVRVPFYAMGRGAPSDSAAYIHSL